MRSASISAVSYTVSIVVFTTRPIVQGARSQQVLNDLLSFLLHDRFCSYIAIVDNSPKPYFDYISKLQAVKIRYVFSGKNLGYSCGHNLAKNYLPYCSFHLILNPDIIICKDSPPVSLANYMHRNPSAVMTQPLILSPDSGSVQYLCKRNPSLLIQLIRGFFPFLAGNVFRRYMDWYEMRDVAYALSPVHSEYLSGAYMMCRRSALDSIGWFDSNFFMYLEDADLTRRMSQLGLCLHVPQFKVGHIWARGSHSNFFLRIAAIRSFFLYSRKWGLVIA
jgi:GT2 family glycosyltransferase